MTEVKVFKELQYLISYPENFRPEENYDWLLGFTAKDIQ